MSLADALSPANQTNRRHLLSRVFILTGLTLWAVAGSLTLQGQEPFHTWYFVGAWWSYIVFVDGWVYRRKKESLLLTYPGYFCFLALWSVVLWFIFEAFNLRLNNWLYRDIPASPLLRWPGYFLAFSTVVPAILETADLLDSANIIHTKKVRPLGFKKKIEPVLLVTGALMLALPLLWPKYFFPLVWGGFVFLLDPLNERWGGPSLLSDWRVGNARRFLILLISGFFCGGLWEWWNFWAGARWVYTVPWVGDWTVFEMPFWGYLGFPPFAVTAFVMTASVRTLWNNASRPIRVVLAATALAFCLGLCWAVDRFTVSSWQI